LTADSNGASVSTHYAVTKKKNSAWSRSDEHTLRSDNRKIKIKQFMETTAMSTHYVVTFVFLVIILLISYYLLNLTVTPYPYTLDRNTLHPDHKPKNLNHKNQKT
jgi:hypothetical protein